MFPNESKLWKSQNKPTHRPSDSSTDIYFNLFYSEALGERRHSTLSQVLELWRRDVEKFD